MILWIGKRNSAKFFKKITKFFCRVLDILVTKTVDTIKWQSVLIAELVQPKIQRSVLHRLAVPFGVEPVGFNPLIAVFQRLLVLFRLVLLQHIHNLLRKFKASLRLFGLGSVGVNALFSSIIRSSANVYDISFKVHIFPLKPQHFDPSETAVNHKVEESTVFQRLAVQKR